MGTTKKRFIEIHGEEAWKIEAEKRKRRDSEKYLKNRDHRIECQRIYNEKNRDIINKKQREYDAIYYDTPRGRSAYLLSGYRNLDKKFNRGECTITQKWILENIFTSSCTYCGESDWKKLGCDRIDNTLPHTPENCICACLNCNNQRSNRWSVEDFKEYKQKGRPPIEPPCHNSTPLN